VKIVPSLAATVTMIAVSPQRRRIPGILIDPRATVEKVHSLLDRIAANLTCSKSFGEPESHIYSDVASIRENLTLPAHLH
jgi:hypothetical protein